jgi:hypothetical protein
MTMKRRLPNAAPTGRASAGRTSRSRRRGVIGVWLLYRFPNATDPRRSGHPSTTWRMAAAAYLRRQGLPKLTQGGAETLEAQIEREIAKAARRRTRRGVA